MTNLVRRLLYYLKNLGEVRYPYAESPNGSENSIMEDEAEKQRVIWDAFGVDYKRELSELEEAKNIFLMQLNSGIMNDEMRKFIERVVRDEVKKVLRGRGV